MQRSRFAFVRVFLAVLGLLLVSSSQLFAATLHVPGEYATIQAAIDAAVVGDIVEVACGTYPVPEIIMKSGITLRSATGQADCVILKPEHPYPPEDDADGQLFHCIGDANTTIEGITFSDAYGYAGAQIYFEGAPRVRNCRFTENSGREGPHFQYSLAARARTDCSPSPAPIVFSDSDALVTDCLFDDNDSAGGGVAACGTPTFVGCQFNGNRSEFDGGAVWTNGGLFVDCTFLGNWASFRGGAASSTETTFRSCLFRGNQTQLDGGAVFATNCEFEACTFVQNVGAMLGFQLPLSGGGALATRGECTVTNCTFSGNDAGPPRQSRSSSAGISDVYGAAIFARSGSVLMMTGNIISGNIGSEAIFCAPGATINVTCSNIFGNPDGDWTGCIADQLGVDGNISVDPMFCDAGNGDFHLSSLSPCLYAECGVMGAFGQGCFDAKPALYDVSDVGNDQGRQVRLTWQRSLHDSPTANPYVVGYAVYRKKDQYAKEPPVVQAARGEGVAILGWDYLGTVPSRGDSIYETVVPTLCDSTISGGMCASTFFLSAMTQNPFVFYDSPQQSGYSMDNLAPPTPTGFAVAYNTGDGNELSWNSVAASDWAGFRVYREGTAVATTTQTSWTDPDMDGWSVGYGVTAFDNAGNESARAVAGTVTSTRPIGIARLELLPNIPNPFNPSTRLRYSMPTGGEVRVAIYDARGSLVRVLVDKSLPAGHHDAVWDGRDANGSTVSSGVYMCRLEHQGESRTRKIVLIK